MRSISIALCIALSLTTVNCSKVEHGLETADHIKASTERLEVESSQSLRKQKESGAIAAMGIAIQKLKVAITSTGRLAHATRYFAAMPFQFIYKDEERKNYYYKITLADFLADRFAELTEGRTEQKTVRVRLVDGTFAEELRVVRAEHTDVTEDYNPSHFPELAALAVRMHYISVDQYDIDENPVSFLDLIKELFDAVQWIDTCNDCSVKSLKPYIQANMQFSGQLIDFLQFAHNTLSIAGLKGVIRDASKEEKDGQWWYYAKKDYLSWLLTVPDPSITQNSLVKLDTNAKDIELSMERFARAEEIRSWLRNAGIEPVYSKYVFEEKFGIYLDQPMGVVNRSSLNSNEKQQNFTTFMERVKQEYQNYKDSAE